ncbi:subtilisin-like protease-like protein, partial [Trifolium pratense]
MEKGAYKFVPELWLKKQPLKKQYDVMRFMQMFSEHHHEPTVPDKPPQTGCKIKQSYIVCLGSHRQADDRQSMTNSHGDLLGPHVQRYLAMLNEEEAAHISKHPNVQYVSLSETSKLLTTHSWVFLRLAIKNGNFPNASIWKKSLGEDIIIGNIDTGVWPESESFNDEGMGPIPAKWRGICQTNRDNWDNFHCNKKLIGARYFYQNFCQSDGGGHSLLFSPRDYDGHGTHTLATAGGNFVPRASSCGLGHGTASGGAPRARVACYKVCWPNDKEEQQCNDLDVVDAYDAAIHDGVDVISVSMGYDKDRKFTYGGSYRSSFKAVANGKIVVKAAGNKGPEPKTIVNCEPWAITVAATTTDRDFFCDVTLGDNRVFKAKAFNKFKLRHGKFYPLASGADVKYHYASDTDAMFCKTGALDPNKVKGKIIFCYLGGGSDENTKAKEAYSLGAIGLILGRDRNREVQVVDDQDPLPTAHVDYKDAVRILKYINYNR